MARMNEAAIERLSVAQDVLFSQHSLGGMYDTTDYRTIKDKMKTLVPGKTDAFGNEIQKEEVT